MGAIGRNDPCPCGSGRKYKKCCIATGGGAPYTAADREAALQRLLGTIHPDHIDDARERFWGEHLPRLAEWRDSHLLEAAENALQFWMFFDELDEGETLAELLLEDEHDLTAGERRYLEMGRDSSMRLYEVVAVEPGASVTLREVLGGSEVRVHERAGSRSMHTWDLVAARVMARGVSGQAEIDGGIFPLRRGDRDALVRQLAGPQAELDDAELKEALPIFFGSGWAGRPMPKVVNFDGEVQILTRVLFEVTDEAKLVAALDGGRDLERDGDAKRWAWEGIGKERKEKISRGFLDFEKGRLVLQTNSRERGERGRALIERLAGDAVKYLVTEYEDLEQAVRSVRDDPTTPPELPEELREPARVAIAEMLQQHYEKWLEEPVPALDGATPRAAASSAELRPRVAGMIEDLEGMYERALEGGSGAFDPTWMWEELGLEDLARGRSRKQAVPRLPHEAIATLEPELVEVAADLGDRVRRQSKGDTTRTLGRQELEGDLGVHRLVRESVRDAKEDGAPESAATQGGAVLSAWIETLANFELHLRKTFWVDEGLSWMLGATGLDVTGEALRPPFASFALVFTDRYALGLAERLLAEDPSSRLHARILSVLTVYVTSSVVDDERIDLRVGFAADANDGGWPTLLVHDLVLRNDARITELLRTASPGADEGEELSTILGSPPLRSLLALVLNAILYATSADADAVPGDPRGKDAPPPRRRRNGELPPNDGVFHLPGKIDVTSLRRLKAVRRGASDVQAIRRCMVRGHWRRAAQSWKDARPRWIKPHWRGPSAAAIVERQYRLK